jgi:MtN3 and saliva related transmembrane protein
MKITDFVGILAGICTTIAFLPQVTKIYRSRHTSDLSLPMYIIFSFGVLCWAAYGFLTSSVPVIVANGLTFMLCLYILFMKLKYG